MTGDVSVKGTRVLRITLWVFWGLWAAACVVLAVGAVANHLASRTQTLPLVLSPGASAEIAVYREGINAHLTAMAVLHSVRRAENDDDR